MENNLKQSKPEFRVGRDGTALKIFIPSWDGVLLKIFRPMRWDDFANVSSHPIPWDSILVKYRL